MCGIFGSLGTSLTHSEISAIKHTMRHRGPDSSGCYRNSGEIECTLLHTRLSIVDRSQAGAQPMSSADGRYTIAYNGEVYNAQYLKNQLTNQHGQISWRGHSDTEVILKGWELEGKKFISKLNGIFAFIIFDKLKEKLFAIRDPFGIKPLFLTKVNRSFFLSSELKCFNQISRIPKTLNIQSLKSQLTFMYIPEPETIYDEVKKLQPGYLYTFDRIGQSKTNLFQNFMNSTEPNSITLSLNDQVDEFRTQFFQAVNRNMVSDVPIGVMLSGGLDSSAIVAGAYESGNCISAAFTLAIDYSNASGDKQSNDYYYAKIISDKYNIPLYEIEAKSDYFNDFDKFAQFFEDGYTDPASLATYYLSKLAKDNGISVLLTGQGADEMLFGYRRYIAANLLSKVPDFIRLGSLLNFFPKNYEGRFSAKYRRLLRFLTIMNLQKDARYADLFTWCEQSRIDNVFIDKAPTNSYQHLITKFGELQDRSVLQKISLIDKEYDLASLNLCYSDRMSMAASVEARVPFLDFLFAQYCVALPDHLKLKGSCAKYILKKSMEGYLPKEVIYREKAGFGMPIRSWVNQWIPRMGEYFDRGFLKTQGIFDCVGLDNELQKFKKGDSKSAQFLYSYLVIQKQLAHLKLV